MSDNKPLITNQKLLDFVKNNIMMQKINEREWGGFELQVSFDKGQSWGHIQRPFGFGFTPEQAMAEVLTDMSQDAAAVGELISRMGPNLWNQLQDAMSDGPVDETVVQVETPEDIQMLKPMGPATPTEEFTN